jgi:hypothetical protein
MSEGRGSDPRWWACEWCYPLHPDAHLVGDKPERCAIGNCPEHGKVWLFPTTTKPDKGVHGLRKAGA